MVRDVRAELGQPELPFVAGQIGEFLYTRTGNKSPFARQVNDGIAKLSDLVPHAAIVESRGLTHKGDELHFDVASEREMGRRYADEMAKFPNEKLGKD